MGRAKFPLVLSISFVLLTISAVAGAERWSRQVSNSEWIPLANPRSHHGHNQNVLPPPLPQIHQPLIPGSLPPELRQEYQQQLLQLQKTQESIQRLLLLQQQLKAQQQLLQGQASLPDGTTGSEGNEHQSGLENSQHFAELDPESLVPPQLSGQPRPPVYTSQNFREPQGGAIRQEQYEDYNDRQVEDYRNSERTREDLREKDRYVAQAPTGQDNDTENNDDGDEEVQVVYVPAETLAQRGQSKSQQRGHDRKQFGNQDTHHHHQQRPYANQQSSLESNSRQRENVPTTVPPEDDAYARDFLQQLQREHEGTDRLLKEAREKELERLREERKEIQRRAKLQQAAVQREQEIQRQREAEKKRKELAQLEEAAKQRELERIRESRERQRLEEIERTKKAQARANEEKRKQEEARQAEIERLAVLERQKKAEIERTIAAQKELERVQKMEEERAREAERSHLTRQKEASHGRHEDTGATPQAQLLVRNQQTHQQLPGQSGKYNRHGRIRNKPRQRQQNQNVGHSERTIAETTTTTPPSPNQPPLAVYMNNLAAETRVIRITDVLKVLKDAKTIDVLDNVNQDAPEVFVGPSSLEVPGSYAKFDLPYLSSIDNNRVERRVDKLPFFVAPLSFNPPPGYSKIPFPAPHIGSVVVNTLDSNIPVTQPDGSLEEVKKSNLSPLIEPNSFSDDSNQGISYSTSYDSSTTPSYTNLRHEEPSSSTPQYQSSLSYSNVETSQPDSNYKFHQSFNPDSAAGSGPQEPSELTYHAQLEIRPTYPEVSGVPGSHNTATQYTDDTGKPTTPVYRRPNVVTSFAYEESPQPVSSSTPTYQQSYSNVRDESSNGPGSSQLDSGDRDASQHRQAINHYQYADQRKKERLEEYPSGNSGLNHYENSPAGPTQYNLPAELPPIHPQLPGLVNSLLDENEQASYINKQPSLPTTTSTTTTKRPATTEIPITTQRPRGRQRGRIVATRPSTTTTTTLSPPTKSRDTDRTRRPYGRTRSRYTTTTEEYRETYEPTKMKVTTTTPRYNSQDNHRRPTPSKNQRYKNRDSERTLHSSRNQVHNVQAQEAAKERKPSLDPSSRQPETTGQDTKEPVYSRYDYASATTSRENYPIPYSDERRADETVYAKTSSPPRSKFSGALQHQEDSGSQRFQETYPGPDFNEAGLEAAPINGFNYQTRTEQVTTASVDPSTPIKYAYYQNKEANYDNSQTSGLPIDPSANVQNNDYQRPGLYEDSDLSRPQANFPINHERIPQSEASVDGLYDPYSPETEDGLRATGLLPEQAPFELTTEPPTTTTTTTQAAPVIIRQRVRARLGGRGRPDSIIQTKPRGSQDEYVRFSAVNNQNTPTTERPTSRHRESQRAKPKTRQQNHGVQVQTEGNDYVRIQAPIRTYQKTIVTPPSTTQRPTTTQVPTTTPVDYEISNDEIEYGFIRPPNFAPIQPVENRYQTAHRPGDNQAQLQSIVPTDESAADTIPSHAQVTRNRPKHQSLNRRPTSKTVSSTTLTLDTPPHTERPRTRVEEPRNNRIRARGRKPGKKRTTTTTTTTTEYFLEENNDLPPEENYPHPVQTPVELSQDGQVYYDEKFEALPLASLGSTHPVQQEQRENPFSSQDFLLNFGSESDQPLNPDLDQTQLASQPPRKYGKAAGTRSKTDQTYQGTQDRDIYGSESQWSTKLTSTSFQPSPSINGLTQNDQNAQNLSGNDKTRHPYSEASRNPPEVITAAPEDSYVTILVTSDGTSGKSAASGADKSSEVSSLERMNYGMKTSFESQQSFVEKTTPASNEKDQSLSNSTDTLDIYNGENYPKPVRENQQLRKAGGRRRRVRVRVRPAATEDFVTAESQHFNSAMNSLIQDRLKHGRRRGESRKTVATTQSPTFGEYVSAATPGTTLYGDLVEDFLKIDNESRIESEETFVESNPAPTTFTLAALVEDVPKILPRQSENVLNQTPLVANKSFASESDNDSNQSQAFMNQSEFLSTTVTEPSAIKISENTTNDLATTETTTNVSEDDSSTGNFSKSIDSSSDSPLMTTMTIPRKSWDSTKSYKDSPASNNSEYSRYSEQNTQRFDDNDSGQVNEVLENDYRVKTTKDEDNSLGGTSEAENYPKNHRSEWSEVHYPTNPESYHYNRQFNLTTTQLPGLVTKNEGDTSVKTLSDYVKAIFDTMKNVDGQKSEKETYFDGESITPRDELISTVINDSSETRENSEDSLTTIPSSFDDATTNSEMTEYPPEKSAPDFTKQEAEKNIEDATEVVTSRQNSDPSDKGGTTEEPRATEILETTKYVEETTETSTEINSIDFSSLPVHSESSTTSTSENLVNPSDTKIEGIPIPTTNNLTTVKNSTETNLGAILRTSTTTKVSHMTEICYRGRCVMTKPKKEIYER